MTLAEIRAAVKSNLRDAAASSQSRWPNSEIDRYINMGLLDIARSADRRKLISQNVAGGAETVAMPNDCLVLEGLAWEQNGVRYALQPASGDLPGSNGVTGLPTVYWILGDYVYLRPVPNANGTLWFVYRPRPPALVNDSDTPSLPDVDNLLIAYATWKCFLADGDGQFQLWQNEYTMELSRWLNSERQQQYKARRVLNRLGGLLNG